MGFKCNFVEQKIARANGISPYDFALEKKADTYKYQKMMENAYDSLIHNDGVVNENDIRPWYVENQSNEERRKLKTNKNIFNKSKDDIVNEFNNKIMKLEEEIDNIKKVRDLIFVCPECGDELREIEGRYGLFIGCSNFPDCTYSRKNW